MKTITYKRLSLLQMQKELEKVKRQLHIVQKRQQRIRAYSRQKKKSKLSKSLVDRRLEELKQRQKDRILTADKSR